MAPGGSRELQLEDWGVTYDELEPHFDRFEYLCGISGKAGNLNGKIIAGGNPFEGQRARDYPNPPLTMPYSASLFTEAAQNLGFHPFPAPAANLSRPYVNPLGVAMGECTYCGYCERFGCANYSKATPQTTILPVLVRKPNFEARPNCEVLKINLAPDGKTARSVTYVDAAGREFEQPGDLILLCGYGLMNVRMMLLSGIGRPYDPRTGKGTVGRNYCYQTQGAGARLIFEGQALQSLHRRRGAGGHHRRLQRRRLRPCGGWISWAAAASAAAPPAGGRSVHGPPRPAPRAGARPGKRPRPKPIRTPSASAPRAPPIRCAAIIWISIPPTPTGHGRPLLRVTFDYPDNDSAHVALHGGASGQDRPGDEP